MGLPEAVRKPLPDHERDRPNRDLARVTVVIAAWRAGSTIGRAVTSALRQPEAAEVIVVDDASSDDGETLKAARAADDGSGRLKVIALETNGGPARARNIAIAEGQAPWICVLDSDDYMRDGRLKALLGYANETYDLIADDLYSAMESENPEAARVMGLTDPNAACDISFAEFVERDIAQPGRERQEIGFIKPLMRRSLMEAHGVRYREDMRLGEDYDLYAQLMAHGGRMRLTPATGYVSIWRKGSLSDNADPNARRTYLEADNRLLAREDLSADVRRALLRHRQETLNILAWVDFAVALKKMRPFTALGVMLRGAAEARWIALSLARDVRAKLNR